MLFPYHYIDHPIEEVQKHLDYIFFEIWAKADTYGEFDITLFNGNQKLKNVILDFMYASDTPGQKNWRALFIEKTKEIFEIFKTLSKPDIKKLKYWYMANNNISRLCNKRLNPIKYDYLKVTYPDLSKELEEFYTMLYDHILEKSAFQLGSKPLLAHNNKFVEKNNKGVCPFCGLSLMKDKPNLKQDAYDHFLPKAHYPFNSVQFKNLAPMCDECNKRPNKGTQDPIYDGSQRRKVFYPYTLKDIDIHISLSIEAETKDEINEANIKLDIHSNNFNEEVETWKSIFRIEKRYKEVCTSNAEGKEWLWEVEDELSNYNYTIKDLFTKNCFKYLFRRDPKKSYIETLNKFYKRNPYARKRFLQVPFLKACQEKGII